VNYPITLTSRGGKILGAAIALVTLISFVITIVASPDQWFVVLGGHALIISLCWALGWFPAVVIEQDAVTLRNILRSRRIPYAAIDEVNTRFGLALVVQGASYSAWAAPAPGALYTMLRLDKKRIEHLPETTYELGTVRAGDDPNTESGVAALHIRRALEELEGRFNQDPTALRDVDKLVTTQWHLTTIATLVASAALLVAVLV
jgi:hypothetical protein